MDTLRGAATDCRAAISIALSRGVLANRSPDQDGNVVASTVVERFLQQGLAALAGRRHVAEDLGDPLVGDVLGEAVAAEETGRAPSLVQAGHDRSGLLASDAARKDMGPAGASDLGTGENSCVKQLLRHGLIA